MAKTNISWTKYSYNPWIGCFKVSAGCKNCYFYRDSKRYGNDPKEIRITKPATFNAPLKWARKDPGLVFVSSWTDFFLAEVDQEIREKVWDIIRTTPQNTYQILTKRPENILEMLPGDWGYGWPHVWLGVSVENQEMADLRIPQLLDVPAQIHWLSIEPLLGPIELTIYETCPDCDGDTFFWVPGYSPGKVHQYENPMRYKSTCENCGGTFDSPGSGEIAIFPDISWTVIGGESGPDARPMDPQWAISIRDECEEAGIPFFMKQMGGWPNTRHKLEDMPIDLRLREFPAGW